MIGAKALIELLLVILTRIQYRVWGDDYKYMYIIDIWDSSHTASH